MRARILALASVACLTVAHGAVGGEPAGRQRLQPGAEKGHRTMQPIRDFYRQPGRMTSAGGYTQRLTVDDSRPPSTPATVP